EVARLIGPFRQVVESLAKRGNDFTVTVATLPKLLRQLEQATASWPVKPTIVAGPDAKTAAFANADVAMAASGTVLLELALARVPMIAAYRLDWLMRTLARRFVTAWSAALPNLIADSPLVPEAVDEMVRPAYMARQIEQLWS